MATRRGAPLFAAMTGRRVRSVAVQRRCVSMTGSGRRHLRQPYYYTRWYCCVNHYCATTLIMPEAHKVWNRLPPKTEVQAEFEFQTMQGPDGRSEPR
jgi:hypothetical protein